MKKTVAPGFAIAALFVWSCNSAPLPLEGLNQEGVVVDPESAPVGPTDPNANSQPVPEPASPSTEPASPSTVPQPPSIEPGPAAACPASSVVAADTARPGERGPCNCTRRPDGTRSYQCAIGVGQSATVKIGPEGGTVELIGQQGKSSGVSTKLTIPPTALRVATNITITETSAVPPRQFVDLSPVYQFSPAELQFALPVEVRMPMGNGNGSYSRDIGLYWSNARGGFERLPDSYMNAGFMQGSVLHLGAGFVALPACAVAPECRP